MKIYQKLIQERADLVGEAKGIFALADAEGRSLTDEEKVRDDEINARLGVLAGDIERLERQRERERTMTAVSTHGIQEVRDRVEDDPMRGFKSMADFALAVKSASRPNGHIDDRLHYQAAPTNFHRETGSDEGYMVPPQLAETVWELTFAEDSLLTEVDNEPTSRNAVDKVKDESTPWGSAGVQAYWRAEGSQMTPSKLSTEKDLVRLHELYAFVLATEELLEDAPRLNDRLTRKSALAIRWKSNEAIFDGNGVGQPLGWTASSAIVTQAKESSQAAATIVAKNIAKMYARIIGPSQAIWFINQDAISEIITLELGNQPIWTAPQSGFQNAPGGLLLGRPVRFSEHCETLGAQGDIQLVNPMGYYAVSKRNDPTFASSMHLYFDYNLQAFRWTFRLGGQPHLSGPVSPAKGSTTRSHFVQLAVRS
jgi:HK97 family phage major capsid protein